MTRSVSLFLLLIALAPGIAGAETDELSGWLRSYYQSRTLETFDRYWTRVIEERRLEDPAQAEPIVAFVGRLVHDNPGLLRTHFVDLAKYPASIRELVAQVFWISDTAEGRQRLIDSGRRNLASRPVPDLRVMSLRQATNVDFCWGWFFATGDPDALRPIVAALDLATAAAHPERLGTPPTTAAERQALRQAAIYLAARQSLASNAAADPFIARLLRTAMRDPRTPPDRARELQAILEPSGN